MTPSNPIVLVVGAASRDLAGTDPRGWRLGGAVTYVSLALARLGITVRALVGVDAEAATAAELDLLRDAGAIVTLAPLASGPVFDNVETSGGRRQRCLATSDAVPLTVLPRAWTDGHDALVLAPVAGELGEDWAGFAAPIVALGWQGLLRTLVAGGDVERRAPAPSPLLDAATLVVASRDDLPPTIAADALVSLIPPAATLVLTAGEAGGRAFGPADGGGGSRAHWTYPAIPSDRTIDPTGAGDVFLAGMVAARLWPGLAPVPGLEGELLLGAAAASLAVEAPGLLGVPDLAAVRRRLERAPSLASRCPSDDSSPGSGRPSQA